MSSKSLNLKLNVLNTPRITILDDEGYKDWNPPRYDDLKILEEKLCNGKFRKEESGIYVFLPKFFMKEKFNEGDKLYYEFKVLPGSCGCEDGSEDSEEDSESGYIEYEYGCFLKIIKIKNGKSIILGVWMEFFSHLDSNSEV